MKFEHDGSYFEYMACEQIYIGYCVCTGLGGNSELDSHGMHFRSTSRCEPAGPRCARTPRAVHTERERERERDEKSLEIMTRVSGGDSHLLVASSHSGLGNVTTG